MYDNGVAELQKILQMCICVLVWLATEWSSLHHIDEAGVEFEVEVPTLTLGPVATLAVEGMDNSRRVISTIASGTVGASELGFCTGRVAGGGMTRSHDLLTSFSGFSV